MVMIGGQQGADINFQGKHAGEQFEFYFYQHWILLAWPLLKLLIKDILLISVFIIMFFIIGAVDDLTRRVTLSIFSVFFLLSHMEFLSRLYRYFLHVTVVTDRRVHRIRKSLLFMDDHQSIDLWMLQDVTRMQHSLLENVFGFGRITLEAADTSLTLHCVPHIAAISERIMSLREQARDHTTPYSVVRRMGEANTAERAVRTARKREKM